MSEEVVQFAISVFFKKNNVYGFDILGDEENYQKCVLKNTIARQGIFLDHKELSLSQDAVNREPGQPRFDPSYINSILSFHVHTTARRDR